jgi:putative ABC transport system substrate-binding protein
MLARRACMVALGATSLGVGAPARAESDVSRLPRVGILWHAGSQEKAGRYFIALARGFRDLGYVDGKNIRFEHRYPNEESSAFKTSAEELVLLRPEVLVSVSPPAAYALQRTGTAIPIVFLAGGADPVGAKLVQSLAHPGSNITGLTSGMGFEMDGKRLQLFKEAVPGLSRVALLTNPNSLSHKRAIEINLAAGASLNVHVLPVEVRQVSDYEGAFDQIARAHVGGVVAGWDVLFFASRQQLARLAIAQRLPSSHYAIDAVESGFLMSYGASLEEIVRRGAAYVDKILRGAQPANLPVELPAKFELCFNLKTARAIGLTIPQSVVLQADSVIA